jgi:hypothetical protein
MFTSLRYLAGNWMPLWLAFFVLSLGFMSRCRDYLISRWYQACMLIRQVLMIITVAQVCRN